jgi:class 3 adenylate cyclase
MAVQPAAERKIVSVLFCDLEGFTALSEELDPEDVVIVQNAYFTAVEETVRRYGGMLEKYIGDAAVAVFGVPRVRDDDAERAVRAGLALTSAVEHLNARLGLEETALRVRVGVNTGEVVQTEGGSERGPVTGDPVNVAARLQTAAPPGGVLLGEATALAVEGAIELESAGELELKGKAAPVRAWRAAAVRPEPAREHAMGVLRAPILGREDELRMLRAELERSRESARRLVLVAPPGVGKTRVVDELAAAAPAAIARARLRPDLLAPYEPVGQLLLSLLGQETRDAGAARLRECLAAAGTTSARADAVLEETLPVVWPDPQGGAAERDLGAQREARFAAWVEALDALAAGEASLWIVEDVHWGGADLLAFLDFAARQPTRAGRLVLATARPSLLEAAPEWCHPVSTVHLEPLSPASAGELVTALVGDALPAGLVETIAERSDGNPLFVEELLRTWIAVGTLVAHDGGWRLAGPAAGVPLPATVQAIYGAQLDDLPPPARAAARRASVAGRRFPVAALEPLGVPDADDAVSVLARRALVSGPHSDVLAGPSYAYRHALLRDAGYASLARVERAMLHVRLAAWLEGAAGERRGQAAEVIARHYARALESTPVLAKEVAPGLDRAVAAKRAAHWFEVGAEAAVELAAHETARSLLRRALELTPEDAVLDEARRRLRLGDVTWSSADMDEGATELARALELFRQLLPDPAARSGLARAAASLGWIHNEQLAFSRGADLADEALVAIGAGEDKETARLLLLRSVSVLNGTDELERPLQDAERALELVKGRDTNLEVDARDILTRIRADREGAPIEDWREVERLAVAAGRWEVATTALRNQAGFLMETDAVAAWDASARASELAEARGLVEAQAWNLYGVVELGLLSGEWDRAVGASLSAIELGERNAYHRPVVRSWFAVLPIANARGDERLLRRAHGWFADAALPSPPAPWARVMATAVELCFEAAGLPRQRPFEPDDEECLLAFDDARQLPSWWAAAETLAEGWLRDEKTETLRRALDLLAGAFERDSLPSPMTAAVQQLLRARLLRAEESPIEAAAVARAAADGFRKLPAPWWVAKSIRLLATVEAAEPDLLAEAQAIERSLRLSGPAL